MKHIIPLKLSDAARKADRANVLEKINPASSSAENHHKQRLEIKVKRSHDALPAEVYSIMHGIIADEYLRPGKPTLQFAYQRVIFRINRENECGQSGDLLPVPHISTFYREVKKSTELLKSIRSIRKQ